MLSGRADLGESRMREICTSGSTREREATVFGPVPFTPCFPLYSTVKAFVNEPDKQGRIFMGKQRG